MQINFNQLQETLKRQTVPIYLISGDVPLLIDEAKSMIRLHAKNLEFQKRQSYTIDSSFNWDHIQSTLQNRNLFDEKQLIELNNSNAKWDEKGTKLLLTYLEKPQPDILMVLTTAKLTGPQQQTRWYKAIAKQGLVITVYPVNARELQSWIQARLQKANIRADAQSVRFLAEMTEGNLLATHQAIEKLRLLYPQQAITIKEMMSAATHHARYSIFDLAEAILAGDSSRTHKIMISLQDEGEEPTLILWILLRELRQLIKYLLQIQQGIPLIEVIKNEWSSRKNLMRTALTRHTLERLQHYLLAAITLDHMIKGIKSGNVWNELINLGLALAGTTIIKNEPHYVI